MKWKRALWAYGLMLPAGVWVFALVFVPLLRALVDGFTNLNLLRPNAVHWVWFDNYLTLWHDPLFWTALKHSLLLTAWAVPLELGFGLLIALALRQPLPKIGLFRATLLFGWVISIVAQVIFFKTLFNPHGGWISQWLQAAGLGSWERNWFQDPQVSFAMVVLLHVWRNAPFFGIGMLPVLLAIPKTLYESAHLDGASSMKQFYYVTLPHLRWIVVALVLGHIVFTFSDYTIVAVSTGGGPIYATEVIPTYLYKQAWSQHELGLAAATGTVMFFLLAAFSVVYIRRQLKRHS